jgi:hypothetical protein
VRFGGFEWSDAEAFGAIDEPAKAFVDGLVQRGAVVLFD